MSGFSAISDAMISSMTASMDPMQTAVRSMMETQVSALKSNLLDAKGDRLLRFTTQKAEAVAAGADKTILDAFDRLISDAVK